MNKFILPLFLLGLLLNSCAKSTNSIVEVYNNNFESGDLSNISNGTISTFDSSKVLGNYNNGEFELSISNLPAHNIIDITFDLYIHDSWEGVQSTNEMANGPDIWQLLVDNKLFINTTFANFECIPGNFCPPQSYPADYPTQSYNPKSGASRTNLPGFCSQVNNPDGTTLYKIHKVINHSATNVRIRCLDMLKQKYALDPKCDESWSVDNIKINAINRN
jgi:hypothetical protein